MTSIAETRESHALAVGTTAQRITDLAARRRRALAGGSAQAVARQEYETVCGTPYAAAARGYIDAVIEPRSTRSRPA